MLNKGDFWRLLCVAGVMVAMICSDAEPACAFLGDVDIVRSTQSTAESRPVPFSERTAASTGLTGSTGSSASITQFSTGTVIINNDNAGQNYFNAVSSVARAAVETDYRTREQHRSNATSLLTLLRDFFGRQGQAGADRLSRIDSWMNLLGQL